MKIKFKNLLLGFDDILEMKNNFTDQEFDEIEIGKAFGIALKELRKHKNLSLKSLGNSVDIIDSTINRYENGINIPTITQAIKIADFFDLPIEVFILLGLDHLQNNIDIPKSYEMLLSAFDKMRKDIAVARARKK